MTAWVSGPDSRNWVGVWALVALLEAGLAPRVPAAPGIHVALSPAYSMVNPGGQFEVDVTVTQPGSAFNGFDVYVGFDSTALSLVPVSPTLQRGSLMTGACGNLFQDFRPTSDSLKCTLVFLCNGISVAGPGQVYRLTFKASMTAQVTAVRFLSGLQFYNAGLYLNPDSSSDALVQIGTPSAVGPTAGAEGPRVSAAPNPCRGRTVIRISPHTAGPQRLEVRDMLGREVRHLENGSFSGGPRSVIWDGRNDSGEELPSGLYLVGLTAPGARSWARVMLIK